MRRALALMVFLGACGGVEVADDEVSEVEQELVLSPLDSADPIDAADLASCIDVPEELTPEWLSERLTYHRGCFDSWVISVGVADCPIGKRTVSGTVAVAGTAMTRLPPTGFLIRARALAAALADLGALASGETVPRIDLGVEGDGVSMSACGTPIPGGLHSDLSVSAELPLLGVVSLAGAADVTGGDGARSLDFLFAISAEPPDGPAVSGELTGTGITRTDGDLCPDAGEIRFTGSIGGQAAVVLVHFVGDGQVVFTFSDGRTYGPVAPRSCRS